MARKYTRIMAICVLVAGAMPATAEEDPFGLASLRVSMAVFDVDNDAASEADLDDELAASDASITTAELSSSETAWTEEFASHRGLGWMNYCGCEDGASCGACSYCGPRWSIRAGTILLHRDDPKDKTLFNTNPLIGAGTELMNASDFNFDLESGFELSVARHFSECTSVEFRYFGVDAWNSFQTASSTQGYQLAAFDAPIGALGPPVINADVEGSYGSDLYSGEFNLVRQIHPMVDVLAGIRALELRDDLRLMGERLLPGQREFNFAATNQLWGFQLGANLRVLDWRCWTVDATAKAGIYANDIATSSLVTRPVLADLTASASNDDTAFVGELLVSARCELAHNLQLIIGYELLGVDGVALASNQVNSLDFTTGTGLHDDGTALYQGLTVGLGYQH